MKTVLVVDDDASVRESLCKVLKGAGYKVQEAADGLAAIKRFKAGEIDLLLLDINLPHKNGWDVFETVTSQVPSLPIIIITGQTHQYPAAVAAGADALMEKPLDTPRLLETIQQLLAESNETRFRRLCGFSRDVRYFPTASHRPG